MNKITSFLSSTKFTLIITIPIILLVIIGSFIPQDRQQFIDTYTRILNSSSTAESIHFSLDNLGLLNVYSSPLFVFLLFLFAINLILCTLKLIPFAKKGYTYNSNKLNNKLELDISPTDIIDSIKSDGFTINEQDDGTYTASKHAIGRFGVIILHLGIIILLLGGFISHAFGYKAVMNIMEGDFDDVAVLKDGTLVPLGFELYLDEFRVLYYDNSTRAKSYISEVRVVKDGKGVAERVIDVNHPLTYNGISFYQTSFGVYPNNNAQVRATAIASNGANIGIITHFNKPFNLDNGYSGTFTDFVSAYSVDKDGQVYSYSDNLDNPAVFLEIYKNNILVDSGWIISKRPEGINFLDGTLNITFNKLYGVTYSTLSVKNDVGTPIVYVGFLIISIGLLIVYLFSYTAIIFRLSASINGTNISYNIFKQRKISLLNSDIKLFEGGDK